MIREINNAAKQVGITAIITNSTERIEAQLNRITGVEQLPILLVSWDYETSISIDEHGFLNNPATNIVCLLMTKSEERVKDSWEAASEEMGKLFIRFVKALNDGLKLNMRDGLNAVLDISYKNVPVHGSGKHSGILGRFKMRTKIQGNCIDKC